VHIPARAGDPGGQQCDKGLNGRSRSPSKAVKKPNRRRPSSPFRRAGAKATTLRDGLFPEKSNLTSLPSLRILRSSKWRSSCFTAANSVP
jgi:hypothetical protein